MKKTGIMICGHGSRSKVAGDEFGLLAKGLKARYPQLPVEYGFLEYSAPNIHMGLNRMVAQGVEEIYAVPGMLFAATHVKNDIPSVLTTFQNKHNGLTIHYGRELGLHPLMIKAFEARILEALGMQEVPEPGALYDTMLVVVGRGTSDTLANAEAAKMARVVAEDLGFGWTETVYSGVTFPSVGRGLEMALKLGYKKIVVAPYFLFSGRLIDRIHNYVAHVAEQNPDVTLMMAHYLSDQTHVIDTFVARIEECMTGEIVDNHDLMRSFHERLASGEVDIHHHHAEFQPGDEESHDHHHDYDHSHSHVHTHDHSHAHSHGHTHAASADKNKSASSAEEHTRAHGHSHGIYKHIAHPHGPRTMVDDNLCYCFMSQLPEAVIEEERRIRKEKGIKPARDKPPH
ncbi:MAG: sirohydrochlorin chelatase [Proteobacteria bacterium]|nr:MAG: sirohydrochlorin chelatase [Pseudomonadota bacterium]